MDSLKILEEFGEVSSENKKIQNYIEKQKPFLYEEAYSTDFIHYTDEDLMDMFICKFHYYKPSVMSAVFGKYRRFYEFCVTRGYISWNPFRNSKFLSYEYLVRMAAGRGNIPYYSRTCVTERCESVPFSSAYYKSIGLSVFEGVRSYAELARLKWKDVDWEQGKLMLGDRTISVSQELLGAYQAMREYECFRNGETTLQFDRTSDALIRPLIRHGQKNPAGNSNPRYLSNAISKKMSGLGFTAAGLYDSGIMYKLTEAFGKEWICDYLLTEGGGGKEAVARKNRELEAFFEEAGIPMSGRDFGFDFKGYGLLLKYGGIQ